MKFKKQFELSIYIGPLDWGRSFGLVIGFMWWRLSIHRMFNKPYIQMKIYEVA